MNRYKLYRIIIILLLCSVAHIWANVPGTVSEPSGKTSGETRIIIFHTNDIHAKIDKFPEIAWYVAEERKKHDNVFFMNAGDNFSGNPLVDQAVPKGEPLRVLMNKMGYDVMAIGNHDFDYGQKVLTNFIKKAKFPILCANVKVNDTGIPQPKPFTILKTAKGIKIAVFGVVQVGKELGIPATAPINAGGLNFSDPYEAALKYSYLKKENHILIGLTHLGISADIRLAEKMKELDVIVGSHSHTVILEPKEHNGVLVTQAGGNANYLGRIELILKDGKLVKKSGTLIDVNKIKNALPELTELVKTYNKSPVLNRVLRKLPCSISGKTGLGYFITDSLRRLYNYDIYMQNSGGIRIPRLKPTVKYKDIYALMPFSNTVVHFDMTAAELRSLLAYDIKRFKRLDVKVSGTRYTVNRTADFDVKSVDIHEINGKPVDETRSYSVGMNSYMATTYKFEHRDPGNSDMEIDSQSVVRFLESGKDVCSGLNEFRAFDNILAEGDLTAIAKFKGKLSGRMKQSPDGSLPAGNLVTDAIGSQFKADISFYPTSSIQAGLLLPVPGTYYKEFTPLLFSHSERTKVVRGKISGSDLKKFLLKRSKFRNGIDLQVSGLSYTILYYVNAEGVKKVKGVNCVLPGGKEILDSALYTVAFDAYSFKRYYKMGDELKASSTSKKTIAAMVNDYLKNKRKIGADINEQRITSKRLLTVTKSAKIKKKLVKKKSTK